MRLALISAVACLAVAQNRDTLETKVSSKGAQVVLEWSKKHPWDADLRSRGASLVVTYRVNSDGAPKEDCLAAGPAAPVRRGNRWAAPCQGVPGANGGGDGRSIHFMLPERLTDAPAGPVCLAIRTAERRTLPIRKADGADTARFRVEGWERVVAAKARRAELAVEVSRLEKEVEVTAANAAKIEGFNAGKGWRDEEACQAIQGPKVEMENSGRPLAEPGEHLAVARQVCILRVWNVEAATLEQAASLKKELPEADLSQLRLLVALKGRTGSDGTQFNWVSGPATVGALFQLLPEAERTPLRERVADLQRFIADWEALSPLVPGYRRRFAAPRYSGPHFGRMGDELSLQDETAKAALGLYQALSTGKQPDPVAMRGVVGAIVEAYTRCVSDGQRQLETSYRSAQELREKTPDLQARVQREMQQECRNGLGKLSSERRKLEGFEKQLAAARARLAEIAAPRAVPAEARTLNGVACTP